MSRHCFLRRSRAALVLLGVLASTLTAVVPAFAAPPANVGSAPARTTPISAAPTATFGIGPANAKGVDGRPDLTYLTQPGSRLSDHVAVVNLSTRPLAIRTYVVDSTNNADGSLAFAALAAPRQDAATWVSVVTPRGAGVLTVGPRSTTVLPVRIHVPANAGPGDHVAGIIASITALVTNKQGRRVNFEQRVALRTFFRVGGDLKPQLSIVGLSVSYPLDLNPFGGKSATVRYTVRNTGNVRLSASQQITISGLFGSGAASAPRLPILFPRGQVSFKVNVPDVYPGFHMTARVSLKPITVLGDVDTGLPSHFDGVQTFWAIPWVPLALVVALLIGALLRFRRIRRGSDTRPRDAPARNTDKQGLPA